MRSRAPRLARMTDDPGFARVLGDLLEQYRATTLPTQWALDQRSQITPTDIDDALALWDGATPDSAPTLTQPAHPKHTKAALLAFIGALSLRMLAESRRYRAGDVTLAAWLDKQLELIKLGAIVAGLAAYGGKPTYDARAQATTTQAIRRQYAYQQRFAQDILDGSQRPNGRIDTRAALYAGATWFVYQQLRRNLQGDASRGTLSADVIAAAGVNPDDRYERNVQNSMEGCAECEEESGQGWQPIGTLSAPGSRTCMSACKCDLEYGSDPTAP